MPESREMSARPAAGVAARALEDRGVLVNMKTGRCFELNRIGYEIWLLFEGGLAASVVCEQLARRYKVAIEVITRDVLAFAQTLGREALLEITPSAPDTEGR
jgi:hypothetical protein